MKLNEIKSILAELIQNKDMSKNSYIDIYCNLMDNQKTVCIKIDAKRIGLVSNDKASETDILAFTPESISTGCNLKPKCRTYMPVSQIVCISDDEKDTGFSTDELIRKNNMILQEMLEKNILKETADTESDEDEDEEEEEPDYEESEEHPDTGVPF